MPSGSYSKEDEVVVLNYLKLDKDFKMSTFFGQEPPTVSVENGIKYVALPENFLTFKNNIGSKVRLIDLIGYAFKKPYLKRDSTNT